MNEAFKELDRVFDSIIDELENPGRSYGSADLFRNLRGEKTEYADYAKVVHTVVVRVAEDKMSASINVVSTADKIRRYTIEELNRAIRSKGIVSGIDSEALMRMVSKQLFNRDVVFAKGHLPENGTDGYVEQLFEIPKDKKTVNIQKDTPICRVIAPTAGTAGADVYGHSIPAISGAPISVPKGDNTAYDKKTGILSASAGGNLSFKNGVYSVCDEYVINGGVTKENGKIEFAGNIIIRGNVTDDAVIVAEKSITINGKVNNASITAGDNISIEFAVKNSRLTTLRGDMHLMSCHDTIINCCGDIEAASLYNCTTKCIGNISCTLNQGSINAGETQCAGNVVCMTAGSRLHEKTTISVGDCTDLTAEKILLLRSSGRIENELEKINRRISTLEIQKNDLGFLTREDSDFLAAAIRIKTQKEEEKIPILERIAEIEKIERRSAEATFKVQRSLHANVNLKIKDHHRKFDVEFGRMTAYANDYGIVLS